jgi:hypothetical protein
VKVCWVGFLSVNNDVALASPAKGDTETNISSGVVPLSLLRRNRDFFFSGAVFSSSEGLSYLSLPKIFLNIFN